MNLKTEYLLEYYDFKTKQWTSLYRTYSRKLAFYQLNKCRECFSSVKYRLLELERID